MPMTETTAIGTRRTTDPSIGDPAGGGLPATSAHPPTAEGAAPRGLIARYRAGASVSSLAKELGVSFDWVAQRIIAAGTRRDQQFSGRPRRRPPELDSDEWLSDELSGGAGVRDLSRRLHVAPSTVRNALRHYAVRRGAGGGVGAVESDPERRFAVATERIERASSALERARRLQASAVSELHHSGLTLAAIADRLETDVHVVEALLAADAPSDEP